MTTQNHVPIWETKLPFEIASGDGALIAKAMRAYRPETSEEEGIINFFIDQFEKMDNSREPEVDPFRTPLDDPRMIKLIDSAASVLETKS